LLKKTVSKGKKVRGKKGSAGGGTQEGPLLFVLETGPGVGKRGGGFPKGGREP